MLLTLDDSRKSRFWSIAKSKGRALQWSMKRGIGSKVGEEGEREPRERDDDRLKVRLRAMLTKTSIKKMRDDFR